MKFSSTLLISGAAVASAASLPKRDYCPVVKKTVQLTWVELKVFEEGKADVWSWEDTKYKIKNSKFDPSQVYKSGLNGTIKGNSTGYPTKVLSGYPTISLKPTSSGKGYATPTGGIKLTNGTSSTITSASSSGFEAKATTTTTSSTTSAEPEVTLQAWPCTNPAVRREWRNLSDGQRDAYVGAVRCLMNRPGNPGTFPGSRSRYEDFVSLHQQLTPSIHSVAQFLPWHRYYLRVFEQVLADECGYTGPLVWWDETLDAGNFANAPLFNSRWFGVLPGPVNGQGVCITETGWGNYQPNLGPGGSINNPHCLSRAVDEGQTANVNQGWVDACRGAQNYHDHRECNEYGPHAYGHNGIGAVMSDVSPSPSDPLFFLHHGFVDRNWKVWQNDAWWNRVYEIGGPADGNGNQITVDYVLTSRGIRNDVRIADVLDTEASYLCYVYDKQ